MANLSKKKGTKAETRVVNFLVEHGVPCNRVVLKGNRDEGDVHFDGRRLHGLLEVKAGKQTAKVSRGQREEWLQEARVEGKNAGLPPFLVIAVHGSSVKDYHVWSASGRGFFYLDEFATWLQQEGALE